MLHLDNYIYREYEENDKEQIINLLSFKRTNIKEYIEKKLMLWDWQYKMNPQQKEITPIFKICERQKPEKIVVGAIGIVPNKFKIDNNITKINWGVDLIVDPNQRGAGIGKKLLKLWQEHDYLTCALNIADISYKLELKLGWKPLLTIKEYLNVINPAVSHWKEYLKYGYSSLKNRTNFITANFDYKIVYGFSEIKNSYGKLWERFISDKRFSVIRDQEYIEWKYFKHPFLKYKAISLVQKDELKATMIYRKAEEQNKKEIIINEMIYDNDDTNFINYFVQKIIEIFKKQKINYLRCVSTDVTLGKALLKRGFYEYKSPPRFNIHQSFGNEYEFLYTDQNDWYVTSGDSDNDSSLD